MRQYKKKPRAQEEQLYTVKVDGVLKEVTLDELTRDYSGQAYIQQQCKTLQNLKKTSRAHSLSIQPKRSKYLSLPIKCKKRLL